MARAHLVNLGRAGDPWIFIPRALAHFSLAPADGEVRFLLASAFGQLGLPTLASEQLAALAPAAARHPSVTQLTTRLATLRDDRVPAEARIATCRANLESLAAHPTHPIDLRSHLQAWTARAHTAEVFRSTCHNTLTRRDGLLLRCAPDAQDAAATVTRLLATGTGTAPLPLYLEGAHPPCWLIELAARTPARSDGSQTPIHWLCAELDEFLDGLALADLRPVLSQPRVRVLVGPEAGDRLAAHLAARLDLHISGPVMATPTITTPARDRHGRDVLAIIDHTERQQAAELDRLKQQIAAAYVPRTRAWYHARFAAASRAAPLRILLPTTRYSTFIQHATRDFAAALTAAGGGHDARVLIEPEDTSQLSQLAAARAIAEQQPDLIVLINYTRAMLGESVPANLPVVTWVQDAMPHLFSRALAETLTDWDFITGHLHPDLFDRFAYPAARSLATPVLVSEAKFHDGPIDPALLARLACDVAYVSHQSQTAESLAARLASEAPGGPDTSMGRAVASLPARIAPIIDAGATLCVFHELSTLLSSLFRSALGREPAAEQHAALFNGAVLPIAERLLRHQMLEWAADISARRGWSLKLFGSGWEKHPTLAPFAAGPLGHGDELRASFQAAGVHLHASLGGIQHQRIMECALSGGLPLVRTKLDDLQHAEAYALQSVAAAAERAEIPATPTQGGWLVHTADHPTLLRLAAQRQRLGRPAADEQDLCMVPAHSSLPLWSPRDRQPTPDSVTWLLGDLDAAGFRTRDELEDRLTRAIERPEWKSSLTRGIASRVREHLTYRSFAPRLIDFLARSLV